MSHFAHLYFANCEILSMRNMVYPDVMSMFWSAEKQASFDEEDEQERLDYHTPVRNVIQRLDIMGFSIQAAEAEFTLGIQALIKAGNLSDEEHRIFNGFSFQVWQEAMKLIIRNRWTQWTYSKANLVRSEPRLFPYIQFLLSDFNFSAESRQNCFIDDDCLMHRYLFGFSAYWLADEDNEGFPYTDHRYVFRSIAEVCNPNDSVIVEYHSLITWGTYIEDDDLCVDVEKVTILVEGTTDKTILEKTLRILHPDLCQYYSFMDFENSGISGGASFLVHTIRAYIATGIAAKTIALFDNDAAGCAELKTLHTITIPNNIRIVRLPDLDYARNYPTTGPQGLVNMDVNGAACGIELYFGSDILTDERGGLIPVRWGGMNQRAGKYQGEVDSKSLVQQKYLEKVNAVIERRANIRDRDWSSMELVLNVIFTAFNRASDDF